MTPDVSAFKKANETGHFSNADTSGGPTHPQNVSEANEIKGSDTSDTSSQRHGATCNAVRSAHAVRAFNGVAHCYQPVRPLLLPLQLRLEPVPFVAAEQ